ncbi:type IV pilin [Halobacteriales archaeon QS_4_66_20]|nr:MAG: type IV pilin [Halobacteriales archaeon QS_4_66_20]
MNLKRLFKEDDAVSPVIGVILMVAITVILAAVIASFVLGLGDQNNPAPTANFDFDYDSDAGSSGQITITHGDGDELVAQNLYIRGQQIDNVTTFGTGNDQHWGNLQGAISSTYANTDTISAGQSATVALNSPSNEYVVNVVWEDPDSDSTSTLSTDRGPDA